MTRLHDQMAHASEVGERSEGGRIVSLPGYSNLNYNSDYLPDSME